jgi:hypothetical protein
MTKEPIVAELPAPTIVEALSFLEVALAASAHQFKSHIEQKIAEIKRYI